MAEAKVVSELKGFIASIALTGSVTPQFSSCWSEMRSYNQTNGLVNIEYKQEYGVLLEAARDAVVRHALNPKGDFSQPPYDWILQIDADATFPPNTLHRMLEQAYVNHPEVGVIGAYSQLKSPPHIPTIDTGSGTWEEHYPGEGIIPVIRTGAHCLFTKTWVFQKLKEPWFRTRITQAPVRAFAEVDGFARQRLAGKNPLQDHPEWATLMEAALHVSNAVTNVGEDSGFCDSCRAHNIPIYVDTDLVTGHVASKVIEPQDFIKAVKDVEVKQRAALGIYSA